MTTAASHVSRRRPRDSEDEIDTTVYPRPELYWDRAMVIQMTRDLAIPKAVVLAPPPAPARTSARASAVALTRASPPPAARLLKLAPARSPTKAATIGRPGVLFTPAIARRNVFLTPRAPADPLPPWEIPAPPPDPPTVVVRVPSREAPPTVMARGPSRVRRVRRRSILPWAAFAMAFGIAFGVGNDRALRAELMTDLRDMKAPVAAALETGSRAVQRVLAAERASAPRPLISPSSR